VSLSVNDRGHLGYPGASSPREDGITSVPHLVGYRFMTFDSVWTEPMATERASVCRVSSVAKVGALKEPEQQWGTELTQ
jgi:hypothetical protein